MRTKLYRPKQLGIIVSMAWFVGLLGYSVGFSIQEAGEKWDSEYDLCLSQLGYDLKDPTMVQAVARANYENCQTEADKKYDLSLKEVVEHAPYVLVVDCGVIAFGWFIGWTGIRLIRRLRRIRG